MVTLLVRLERKLLLKGTENWNQMLEITLEITKTGIQA